MNKIPIVLQATAANFRAERARYLLSLRDVHDHIDPIKGREMTLQLLSMYLVGARPMSAQSLRRVADGLERAISGVGGDVHFI